MRFDKTQIILLGLAVPALAAPSTKKWKAPKANPERAAAVKSVYQTAWKGYYENAFPHDDLLPVSNGVSDDRNGWGATPVDGLSTAIVMEDRTIVNQILAYIPTIDFTTTAVVNDPISLFETNIRYLGGLLSSYDLLHGDGPFNHLANNTNHIDSLLKQAVSLADSLKVAFGTATGIPDGTIMLNPEPKRSGSTTNNVAEAGTLVLEWTRLSALTGDDSYAKLAQKAESYLVNPKGFPEAHPGLVGTFVSLANGSYIDNDGGWSGLMDSFYEYLIKMYLYDADSFAHYKDRWVLAAESTMKYLASHPTSRPDLTFLSQYSGANAIPQSGHLASFAGGNFIFGGIMLNEQKYIDFGIELAVSYFDTYQYTATHIGPEGFQWVDAALPKNDTDNPPPPDADADFYEKAGFWTTSPQYILRPETMESLYYAYRVTGDTKYQDMAWEAFNSITKATRAGSAYSSINDVTKVDGGFQDFMQSFFLAELLKYLYLIFAEDSEVQFKPDSSNGFVFNTEAHPLKVVK